MSSMSPTVIMFVIVETLLAFGLLAGLFYFITVKLKKQIGDQKSKLKLSLKQLKKERLPTTTQTKVKTYLHEQIELTNEKIKHKDQEELTEENLHLLEMRENILHFESKVVSSHAQDEGFWDNIFEKYKSISPEPEVISVPETVKDESQDGNDDDDLMSGFLEISSSSNPDNANINNGNELDVNDVKTEELDRLHGVVSNQYESIDDLKRHIREIEEEDPDFSDYPFVVEMKSRLNEMSMEQEQMAMCVQVMESENDRLTLLLKQYEESADTVTTQPVGHLNDIHNDSNAIKVIAEKLQKAENMIRDLVHSNKSQLKLIASLESENTLLTSQETNAGNGKETDTAERQTKLLVKNLTQTNKEQEQCIIVLESKVESLQNTIETKDGKLKNRVDGSGDNNNVVMFEDSSEQNNQELYAKIAELDLLQADYDSMKQKYLILFQQSKAS